MDYQTRHLSLLDATGLHTLTDEQDDLVTWVAGAIDPAAADALANLFRAIRVHAWHAAARGAK